MSVLVTSEKPILVFTDLHIANMFIGKLFYDDTYNCKFRVEKRTGKTYVIEIKDEDDRHVGYL
jgi:hypothetical protein